MIQIQGQKAADRDQEIPDTRTKAGGGFVHPTRDPLSLTILATGIGLFILVVGIDVYWGAGPVLAAAPWYIPLISAFAALTALCISFLSFGRFYVLRDPLSFWVGSGFAMYGIGQIFYALTWPGLLSSGASILGNLPNTPSWVALVDLTFLNTILTVSTLVRWPKPNSLPGNRWILYIAGLLLFVIAGFGLLIVFESTLPVFVTQDGKFTSSQQLWVLALLVTFALGSILSGLYYRRSGDKLAGYITFPQLALVFICIMELIGGKLYDLWWYLQRVILVGGFMTVLVGLLSEFVRMLRRENEGMRLLDSILDNVPIGLSVTGGPPHFPIVRVSRHGLKMNQRSIDQLIGSPAGTRQVDWLLFLPDGKTQPVAEQTPLYRASRLGEEVQNVELIMQTEDGHQIPILVNASPIRDAQGNIVAAVNTWLDISDRKRAEEILRRSEALYRAIARSVPQGGVFVVDKNLRYLIAEGPVVEKFGYTREMLEGHTVSEIFDAETASRMEARFQRVFSGETISYETERDGRIYWTQHALMDDKLGHVIVITLDITERKLTEKALSESEQRFRAIVNQATAGIIRSDAEGRSIFVNQAFCNMLGFTEAQLLHLPFWTFTHPADIEENKRIYDLLMEKGKPFQLEKRFLCRDGSTLWVNVSAAPILDAVGKPQSAVSIVVDISERKKAEADLQQLNLQLESRVEERTAELQTANIELIESRRRLQILSQRLVEVQEQERHAIARELHDRVGQSLTALNLNLTIINDQFSNESVMPVNNRLLDSIKLVTEMIDIVRDVMSDLRPIVLDEFGLVAALRAYIGRFEERYGIHVEYEQSRQPIPRLGAALEMTILRITQEALLNIARHSGANRISLSLECEENAMLLSIQDNGIGIQSIEEANISNGHGLMIMRERAEAVGGTLIIRSSEGQGTSIEARLPLRNIGNPVEGYEENE
jgi:PAS domain S-box-containing protein